MADKEWSGEERRASDDWLKYKEKLLSDNQDMKAEIKEVKAIANEAKIMMLLLQQKVTTSSATTSAITSAVLGVLIAYFMNKLLGHP